MRRNLDDLLEDGRINLVCFTGDVADWGLDVESPDATDFLDALPRHLGLARDRLFVVPGNHDVHRKTNPSVWRRFGIRFFDFRLSTSHDGQLYRRAANGRRTEWLVPPPPQPPRRIGVFVERRDELRTLDGFLAFLRQKGLAVEPTDPADSALTADRSRAILRSTFELSLDLLEAELGRDSGRLLEGFAALAHAPASGFGRKLGAAIAGLPLEDFESLVFTTTRLSLLEVVPGQDRPDGAWWLHPLLADLLRERMESTGSLSRMTEWFVSRMPVLPAGKESEQEVRWKEVEDETVALVAWLSLVPAEQMRQVERAGSVCAQQ